jgi:mannose-6-phosphate isomerase-like protein (cupin superfamily)
MDFFEQIAWVDRPLAYIIRRELLPAATTFLTPSDLPQQLGFVVYPAGGEIKPHLHRPLERTIRGTSEVLVVKKGRCEVDIYNNSQERIATRELREGDILLLVDGGHGFRLLEDTVFVEIKQGPYTGFDEKERF